MYWSPTDILPYQRIFNFVNGPRSIGKTYSLLKWLIKQGLRGKEFVYVVRAQDEKKEYVLKEALQKVCDKEYAGHDFVFTPTAMVEGQKTIARCLALTEAIKVKRRSYPNVYYMVFDEYTIEDGTGRYLNGYQEPELFMVLYHTIDREEGRVKCFFLGNNTSYYNPYHLYPAFGLPERLEMVEEGGIWTNRSTLLQRAIPSEELQRKRQDSIFLEAIGNTRYGEYALKGEYRDDRYQPIQGIPAKARYRATIHTNDGVFGVYADLETDVIIVSDKVNTSFKLKCSLCRDGYKSGYPYILPHFGSLRDMFRYAIKLQTLFYSSMSVKNRFEPYLLKII